MAFGLLSCNPSETQQGEMESEILGSISEEVEKQHIKELAQKMWLAFEMKNMQQYASFFHPEYTLFHHKNLLIKKSAKELIEEGENWAKTRSFLHTEIKDTKVVIKGEVAWITYLWTDSSIGEEGVQASKGRVTSIFVKEAGKWLCIHCHKTIDS
ncbi:MAG: nuclear transport factor 2 family protein [Flavobacteriaceae bacterium]|nr:nuclear transport factor 2 family protein [Flavobacteriaceae bacterium]